MAVGEKYDFEQLPIISNIGEIKWMDIIIPFFMKQNTALEYSFKLPVSH